MSIERLLVTGHLGFIGSAFCHMFQERYKIAGVDFAGWGSMKRNLATQVEDIRADIADPVAVRSVVERVRPDAIVNFAAESHVDRANEDDACFWKSNVFGSRSLALEGCRLGIRMVQVSTDEVYGDAASTSAAWTEDSPVAPRNAYSVTKAAAEMLLRVYHEREKHNLDVVFTRGANTIGPRQFPEKAVPKAIWCFTNGKPFPLFRTPARRMWMHVEDHASGIDAALQRGKSGAIYNLAPIANSEEITENVIEKVRRLVGKGEISKVNDRVNYDLRYWMDASKARKELDWEPKYNLDETLRHTVNWYLENGDWLDEANREVVRRLLCEKLRAQHASAEDIKHIFESTDAVRDALEYFGKYGDFSVTWYPGDGDGYGDRIDILGGQVCDQLIVRRP